MTTYTVEVDFTTALLGVPSTWTDVTTYVRGLETRRGRNHELGKMQAGEASLTLDNRDRRFDPTYTSGPYYPNVVPMRHIRIRATNLAVTYDLFVGFVEDWGQQWAGPAAANQGDATCEMHLVDAFSVLNRITLVPYREEILADSPLLYWPLDEGGGATITNLGSVDMPLTNVPGGPFLSASPGPLVGGATAMAGNDAWWTNPAPDDLRVLKWTGTCEFWVYPPTAGSYVEVVMLLSASGSADFFRCGIDATRHPFFGNLAGPHSTSTSTVAAGAWSHVVIVHDGASVAFYINGAPTDTEPFTGNPGNGALETFGLNVASYAIAGNETARLAHVAVFAQELTAERIETHYARTLDAFVATTVDAALVLLLDDVGWPAGRRSFTASTRTTARFVPEGKLLDLLLTLAENTDGGLLFVRADGVLVFTSSNTLGAATTTAAAWGDSAAELKFSGLSLRYDDEDLYTEVRATAEGLADAVAEDATAATKYGPRTLDADAGLLGDQLQLNDRANGLLGRYKAPAIRPETLEAVESTGQAARIIEMLSSEIGRRVTVTRRPPGGGSLTVTSLVEGVAYSAPDSMVQLRTTLNLAPADATPWVLGNATFGVLDSTTDLGW